MCLCPDLCLSMTTVSDFRKFFDVFTLCNFEIKTQYFVSRNVLCVMACIYLLDLQNYAFEVIANWLKDINIKNSICLNSI